jgi:hypothetical protein
MLSLLGLVNFKLVGNGGLELQFGCPQNPFPFVPTIDIFATTFIDNDIQQTFPWVVTLRTTLPKS